MKKQNINLLKRKQMKEIVTGKVTNINNKKYVECKTYYNYKIKCNIFNGRCQNGDNVVGYLTESDKPIVQGDFTIYGKIIRIDEKYVYLKNHSEIIKMNKYVLHTKIKKDFNIIAVVKPDDLSVEEISRPVLKFVNLYKNLLIPAPHWDNVTLTDVYTTTRKRHVVFTRQLIMFLYATFNNKSLKATGKIFNKDHATVLHAKKQISYELERNKLLCDNLQLIINECDRVKPTNERTLKQHGFNTCMI